MVDDSKLAHSQHQNPQHHTVIIIVSQILAISQLHSQMFTIVELHSQIFTIVEKITIDQQPMITYDNQNA